MRFPMSSVQKIFVIGFAICLLGACGLKGDLYLPEVQPQVVDTPKTEEDVSNNNVEEVTEALNTNTTIQESPKQ